MKYKITATVLATGILVSSTNPFSVVEATSNFAKLEGSQAVVANTTRVSNVGWKKINSKWYYFMNDGVMRTGWLKLGSTWYYFDQSGIMATGWKKINSKWYYFMNDGVMRTGWLKLGSTWYYFMSDGSMRTGWTLINNEWYYLTSSGAMKVGWMQLKGEWYYLHGSGKMLKNWIYVNGHWYFMTASGAMKTGWFVDGGTTYYLNAKGQMLAGLHTIEGELYFFNRSGSRLTGWIDFTEGKRYFHPETGKALIGQHIIDGKPYIFDENGLLSSNEVINGWFEENGKKYYYINNYRRIGWLQLEGNWYLFNSNGEMQVGWSKSNNINYYFSADGVMQTGWVHISGNWYYLNSSGAMQTGWIQLAGKWYYLNESGIRLTGKQTINNRVYFFDENGVWTKGKVIDYTQYPISLNAMLDKQMALSIPPQTDKYRNEPAYVSAEYVIPDPLAPGKYITTYNLNVRAEPSATSHKWGLIPKGKQVQILDTANGWHRISMVWRNAYREDVVPYINPSTYKETDQEFYQFLVLSKSAETNVNDLNERVLKGKGIFHGKGQAFLDASAANNINEVYLIAHALLETGNGTSVLSKGILVSEVNGKPVTPKVVYNMFGIGASDVDAVRLGAERAYSEGWFTPEKAISGGAYFISRNYINNPTYKQDTLYKMRWNPAKPAIHQYATDMGWATKQSVLQAGIMKNVFDSLDAYTLYFDVPVYTK
ncbi:glucosaminidase domain-containing protein [Sporosarcina saromensis]|uniref:Glucosaminidase domain-containing protein n=1 Tax=Sporosarcina saromensis TaxID=359365 RepID=A0ABU4GCI8_9BACL|nr:glucosaminidase domain-containing protein [Sporosarcina saromensis]MDW0114038.1 glucosaminidase domain-containing protein [Sporosarcina saromensis]